MKTVRIIKGCTGVYVGDILELEDNFASIIIADGRAVEVVENVELLRKYRDISVLQAAVHEMAVSLAIIEEADQELLLAVNLSAEEKSFISVETFIEGVRQRLFDLRIDIARVRRNHAQVGK